MSRCFEAETNVRPGHDDGLTCERVLGIWKVYEELAIEERHDCGGGLRNDVESEEYAWRIDLARLIMLATIAL